MSPTLEPPICARKVLVVDDARVAAYMLGKLIEIMGHQVTTLGDAQSALAHAMAERPDVIISDIAMPKVSGYEFAQSIRNCAELRNVTLVAITGFAEESDRQLSREAGFDHHLVKPVDMDTLRELLDSVPALPH